MTRPGTDKTAMNFRRTLPEIRWQPCLSPVCPERPLTHVCVELGYTYP